MGENKANENEQLKGKFKEMIEAYKLKDKQIEETLKVKELEGKLYEAKLQQNSEQNAHENAKLNAFKEHNDSLTKNDNELRSQLSLYAEKFDQFQDTLNK